MRYFLDCHVIAPERTAAAATRFLKGFSATPIASFDLDDAADQLGLSTDATLQDCFRVLEEAQTRYASFYWSIEGPGDVCHVMVAFNDDKSMSLGVSILVDEDEDFDAIGSVWLSRLMEATGGTRGRFGAEIPPISLADV